MTVSVSLAAPSVAQASQEAFRTDVAFVHQVLDRAGASSAVGWVTLSSAFGGSPLEENRLSSRA